MMFAERKVLKLQERFFCAISVMKVTFCQHNNHYCYGKLNCVLGKLRGLVAMIAKFLFPAVDIAFKIIVYNHVFSIFSSYFSGQYILLARNIGMNMSVERQSYASEMNTVTVSLSSSFLKSR